MGIITAGPPYHAQVWEYPHPPEIIILYYTCIQDATHILIGSMNVLAKKIKNKKNVLALSNWLKLQGAYS